MLQCHIIYLSRKVRISHSPYTTEVACTSNQSFVASHDEKKSTPLCNLSSYLMTSVEISNLVWPKLNNEFVSFCHFICIDSKKERKTQITVF